MIEDGVRQLLSESAQQALATMFFCAADEVSSSDSRPAGDLIASSLKFQGTPSGRFAALVAAPLARVLATNFFGLDDDSELEAGQVEEIVGELSNIICGAVLSEFEANSNFDISAPLPVAVAADGPEPDFPGQDPVICRLEMPEGAIVLRLAFEEAE
jgi:hypothetical protein